MTYFLHFYFAAPTVDSRLFGGLNYYYYDGPSEKEACVVAGVFTGE